MACREPRYDDDAGTSADYVVVEARPAPAVGENWMADYVARGQRRRHERVLV
ncbi:MAG: DUF3400 domain-containing protein [Betaproteobacteria bacterium]|nr:DUF3400 domain-containing protein [Betaproteobacteria bacterium]